MKNSSATTHTAAWRAYCALRCAVLMGSLRPIFDVAQVQETIDTGAAVP